MIHFAVDERQRENRGRVSRIRLESLVLDESQEGSSWIELVLHQRWQIACKSVRRGDLLRVQCPMVSNSTHSAMQEHQLELYDDPSKVPATSQAMPTLYRRSADEADACSTLALKPRQPSESSAVCEVATLRELDDGFVRKDVLQLVREGENNGSRADDSVPRKEFHFSQKHHDLNTPASTEPATRDVHSREPDFAGCDTILTYRAETEGLKSGQKLRNRNVYGVVVEARAPSLTKGQDLRSELVLLDENADLDEFGQGNRSHAMYLHKFERNAERGLPYRAVGDVLLARRVEVFTYKNNRHGFQLQASGVGYSSFSLFAQENDSLEPIAYTGPRLRSGSQSTAYTATDAARIRSLRSWARRSLDTRVLNDSLRELYRSPSALFMRQGREPTVDVIGRLTHIENPETGTFRMAGNPASPDTPLPGQIELSVHGERYENRLDFEQWSSSWSLRPLDPSDWKVLLRDAETTTHAKNGDPGIKLSLKARSSTVLWLPVLRDYPPRKRLRLNSQVTRTHDQREAHENRSAPMTLESPTGPRNLRSVSPIGKQISLFGNNPLTRHGNMNMPISSISLVRSKYEEPGDATDAVFRIRCRVVRLLFPKRLENITRPWCHSCQEFLGCHSHDTSVRLYCSACRRSFHNHADPAVSWMYDACLTLEDEQGSRIDATAFGEEGARLFEPVQPVDFRSLRHAQARSDIEEVFAALLQPGSVIDCSVKPYFHESEHGTVTVSCTIFGTSLSSSILESQP